MASGTSGLRPSKARRTAGAAVVVAAGAFLAALALARPPWLDETITLSIVGSTNWADWFSAFRLDNQPPAYPVLLTAWAQVSGALPWLRAFSLVAGLGALILAMRWSGTATRATAPLTGLLVATSPVLLRYDVELRPYALLLLATAWAGTAAATLVGRSEARRRHELSVGLALGLAVLTHFTGALLAPAVCMYVLVAVRLSPSRPSWSTCLRRIPWAAATLAVGLGVSVLALKGAPVVRSPADWWMPPLNPALATTTAGELLGLAGPGVQPSSSLLVAATLVVLIAVFVAARGSASRWLPPLAWAVTYWLTVAGISLAWLPIWWPRILTPGLIPLAVAVAVAIRGVPRRSWRFALIGAVIAACTVQAGRWVGRNAFLPIEDWHTAVADLAGTSAPVLCVPSYVRLALGAQRGVDPAHLRLVDPGQTTEAIGEQVLAALASDRPTTTVGLVVRVDLTLARRPDVVGQVAEALRESVTAPLHVVVGVVTSPDVSLVPSLAEVPSVVEGTLTAVLGRPSSRLEDRRTLRLVFDLTPAAR